MQAGQRAVRNGPMQRAHDGPAVPHHQQNGPVRKVRLQVIKPRRRPANAPIAEREIATGHTCENTGGNFGFFYAFAQ